MVPPGPQPKVADSGSAERWPILRVSSIGGLVGLAGLAGGLAERRDGAFHRGDECIVLEPRSGRRRGGHGQLCFRSRPVPGAVLMAIVIAEPGGQAAPGIRDLLTVEPAGAAEPRKAPTMRCRWIAVALLLSRAGRVCRGMPEPKAARLAYAAEMRRVEAGVPAPAVQRTGGSAGGEPRATRARTQIWVAPGAWDRWLA